MQYYMVPITNQAINGQQTFAPKYYSTDMNGLSFIHIPNGVNTLGIVMLTMPSPQLQAEPDVYTFPAILSGLMAQSDVTTLMQYLQTFNVVLIGLTSGIMFNLALQLGALNFLVAQANTANTPQVASQIIASLPSAGNIDLGSVSTQTVMSMPTGNVGKV